MPGCTWWNGLWPPEHSHPGLFLVPGTDSQAGPALEDVWPQCFWGEVLAAWLWKQDTGDTFQCAILPGQPCKARRTCHAWGQACAPGPNGQPHHGILWEQSPPVQLAIPTEWGSLLTPWAWPTCTGHPFLAVNGYTPTCTDWFQGGSVVLDWPFPSIPSLSLAMTRFRTGSTSWAWCQSSRVQDMQITTVDLYGTCRPFEGSLLYSLHCCGCDF